MTHGMRFVLYSLIIMTLPGCVMVAGMGEAMTNMAKEPFQPKRDNAQWDCVYENIELMILVKGVGDRFEFVRFIKNEHNLAASHFKIPAARPLDNEYGYVAYKGKDGTSGYLQELHVGIVKCCRAYMDENTVACVRYIRDDLTEKGLLKPPTKEEK